MNEIILFMISALPVLLLGYFIYKKDKNKESNELLQKLFLSGILSTILVIVISLILGLLIPGFTTEETELNLFELLLKVFIGIALLEEFCKWIFVYKIGFNDKEFDEFYDMIVYAVFVALGFAFFENLFYVYSHGIVTGLIRGVLSVPGHACDGIFMGYYLGLAKLNLLNGRNNKSKKYIILSILVPTLIHGIYDYCLLSGNLLLTVACFIFVITIYILCFKKVKKISQIKGKMKYKNNYCINCGHIVNSDYCPVCGNKNY